MTSQRGSFALGLVVGLLIGLSLALGVALYITKAPIPFINKVPPRTTQQDSAETERNRNWDPNAALAGKPGKTANATGVTGAASPPASTTAMTTATAAPVLPTAVASSSSGKPARDPSAPLAQGNADTALFFVQAGAYTNVDEAEQQRAKLALSGFSAKVTERDQAGRVVHRVRVGPFDKREDAEATQTKLTEAGVDARLVRVER